MIICPNCTKRITTIPGKLQNINCVCKVSLMVSNERLDSYSFKVPWKDDFLKLCFFFGEKSAPPKYFHIFKDGKSILRLEQHPPINPINATEKLKTYLLFS